MNKSDIFSTLNYNKAYNSNKREKERKKIKVNKIIKPIIVTKRKRKKT